MAESDTRWRPTLRLSIGVVLTGMILLTAVVLTVMSYESSRSSLLTFARDLMARNAEMVRLQLNGASDTAIRTVQMMRLQMREGTARPDDLLSIERQFFNDLTVHGRMSALLYGNDRGESLTVRLEPDGSVATRLVTVRKGELRTQWHRRAPGARFDQVRREPGADGSIYDPRTRPWYVQAKASKGMHWTDVYVFFTDKTPGITLSGRCVDRDGRPAGVVGVDMSLADLSRFLAENVRVGISGEAFLLDGRGLVVATPHVADLAVDDGKGGLRLRRLDESPDPALAALGRSSAFRARFGPAGPKGLREPLALRYSVDGVDYIATLRLLASDGDDWTVGVLAKEDECIADAKRANVRNVVTAGVLTVLALIVGALVAWRIARALRLLSRETRRLEQLDFAETKPMGSRFLEVHRALVAFQRMRTGLRAFGMYVPTTLVLDLLEQEVDPALGGQTRDLTLLFSDIRNFTTSTERMPPDALADMLSRYLSAMTDCIHDRRGTVDKYSGDGVMAFWNAPTDVADHPLQACLCALECQRRIAAVEAELGGTIDLYTRIGIHTASVVVGNFGSTDRLNYTAMGDGVNLASRLEGVNKYFGTRILITEDTYARVRVRVAVRRVGLVAVKGRAAACALYELLGEPGQVDPARLDWARTYEQALDHYRARCWSDALALLDRLRAQTPDDLSLDFLTAAIHTAQQDPPPEDWDGAFTMTGK